MSAKIKIVIGVAVLAAEFFIIFASAGAAVDKTDLPNTPIDITFEVPTAQPVVGYPFPVSATFRVNKISKRGTLIIEKSEITEDIIIGPRYISNAFMAPPPLTGKLEPYIVPSYTPTDIVDGMTVEAEFTCKEIGVQPITFSASLSYKVKTESGQMFEYAPEPSITKNVTCAGPKLESFNLQEACGGSATFTGRIGREYLSELTSVVILVNESERGLAGKPVIIPKSDGNFSYTMKLKPSLYHFWIFANPKKGEQYMIRDEGSFDIDKCDDKEKDDKEKNIVLAGIEGNECKDKYASISVCSGDELINYKCEDPEWKICQVSYKAAIDKSQVCEEDYGIFRDDDCRAFPVANPSVDYLDEELAEKFAEIASDCKDGVIDKACCDQLGPARACSAEVISNRKISESCKANRKLRYEVNVKTPCPRCNDSAADARTGYGFTCDGATLSAQPDDQPISDIDDERLAKFRSDVESEAEKIIEIKKCPGSFSPSQNPCVANGLAQIPIYIDEATDVISAGIHFRPKAQIVSDPVLIKKDASGEIVRFKNSLSGVDTRFPFSLPQLSWPSETIVSRMQFKVPDDLLGLRDNPDTPKKVYKSFEAEFLEAEFYKNFENSDPFLITGPQGRMIVTNEDKTLIFGLDENTILQMRNDFPSNDVFFGSAGDVSLYDLKLGTITVEKEDDSQDIEVITPLTITKSKHTKFAVLYNPEGPYAATTIYEGEVEVMDRFSGETVALTPTDDGKPRVLVVPLAQAEDSSIPIPIAESKGGSWIYLIILLALLGGISFWFYKKGIWKNLKQYK